MSIADALLIVGSVSGILSLVITALRERNKPAVDSATANKTEAEHKKLEDDITNSVLARVRQENGDLKAQVDTLRVELKAEREARQVDRAAHDKEITEMRGELDDLRMGVGILTAQLIEVGKTPRWKPRNAAAPTKPETVFKR